MSFGIYFVTPDGCADDIILAALRGGSRIVQLRDKQASDAQMIAQARRIAPQMAQFGARLVINDRITVALAVGADGLHIGQGDGDPRAARAALGPDRLLGLSIENAGQIAAMPADIVDYIGAGPVRATGTKPDHAPPIGLHGLAQVVAASPVPVVAIGGLGLADCAALHDAGCAGMAVVSAISAAPDAEAATRALVAAWEARTGGAS